MQVVFNDSQKNHDPEAFLVLGAMQPNPEAPERADRLLKAALGSGHELVAPADHGIGPIAAVHTPEYLAFLEGIHAEWTSVRGASEEVLPNIHPVRWTGSAIFTSPVGKAGYFMADTACPITADTWASIVASAQSAIHAAMLVRDGARQAYALCRPPGHHAFADMAGGFCYLNNSGIAAQILRGVHERVAILDVDVHHGNGTQGMFYGRNDVLTVSLHRDPTGYYPFYWGHAHERGEGQGLGYNLNIPLPKGTGDDEYMPALTVALEHIRRFRPGALVVALGLDAFEGDPLRGLRITTEGFGRIGEAAAGLGLPTLIVQEGGYLCDELGANLASFLSGFGAGRSD